MEVGGIDIRGSTSQKYAVDVRVRDEHSLLKVALKSLPGIDIMYTIEINPSLLKNSVFVLPVKPLDELPIGKNNQTIRDEWYSFKKKVFDCGYEVFCNCFVISDISSARSSDPEEGNGETGDEDQRLIKEKPESRSSAFYEQDQKIVFQNLDPATSYTITVSTVMNGIEIASKEAKIYQMG